MSRFDVDRTVRCDIARVQQLASNLLGNALTHARRRGPVEISARTDETDLILEVWKRGEPIPPDHVRKIFEPFCVKPRPAAARGSASGSTSVADRAGTRRAHERHVPAEAGTRFTVRLPLA